MPSANVTIAGPIQVTRGLKSALPTSGADGQLFFCTDTGELFVWSNLLNAMVGPAAAVASEAATRAAADALLVPAASVPYVLADNYAGADWGDKVNAANAALGAKYGVIVVRNAAGQSAIAADVVLSTGHVLFFAEGGTYSLGSHSIKLAAQCAVFGLGRNVVTLDYTGNSSAIQPSNSAALTRDCQLRGFSLTGHASTGIGLDLLNANSWLVEDFYVSGFNGTGGVGLRIRGQGIWGAYYNRFHAGFFESCETAILSNSDNSMDSVTSLSFDEVHINSVTNGYDLGGGGWIRNSYIENVTGIGIRCRTINCFFSGINLDNGSSNIGTGLQFDTGANVNSFQGNIGGFATAVVDNGINNDYTGYRPFVWKINKDGSFTGYNAANADLLASLRAGLTADYKALISYQNHDSSKVWYGGISDTGKYALYYNSLSFAVLALDSAGTLTVTKISATADTQTQGDNSTKLATTAYADGHMPKVVASVSLNNQTASIPSTTLYTPAADGLFRLNITVRAQGASSGGTISASGSFWSPESLTAVGLGTTGNAGLTSANLNGWAGASFILHAKAGQPIQYNTTLTPGSGSPKYGVDVILEQIG